MYNLNIKELRKKKGWSQDTLAKKIGVSRQTIVNYEKGEVIPESKKELLYNILQDVTENIVQESSTDYQILPGYQRKIFETELEIQEYEKTIDLKKSLKEDYSHEKTIINILRQRINVLVQANKNHLEDL